MSDLTALLPQISRITDFGFDNAVQIFGEGITSDTTVLLYKPSKDFTDGYPVLSPSELPSDGCRELFPDVVLNQVLYVNASNRTGVGVQIAWLKNASGISKPVIANKPVIFGSSLLKGCAGDLYSLYGNNFGGDDSKKCLLIGKETGKKYCLDAVKEDKYTYSREEHSCDFILPEDIETGLYSVYIHSGSGGDYGWSEPIELEVIAEKNDAVSYYRSLWNDTVYKTRKLSSDIKVITVRPDEELFADMADTIQTAIDSLSASGGIVRLLPGTYEISKTLKLKNGVVLMGSGADNTVIKASSMFGIKGDFENVSYYPGVHGNGKGLAKDWKKLHLKYNPAALLNVESNCGVTATGFKLGGGANVGIVLSHSENVAVEGSFVTDCRVDSDYKTAYNDERRFGAFCTALLSPSRNIDCVFKGNIFKGTMPVCFLPSKNEYIKFIDNIVECVPAQVNESFFGALYHSLVIGNRFLNGRRSFMSQCGFEGNFVYQNRSRGVARSGNALEVYMSEYGETVWHGRAENITHDALEITGDPNQEFLGEATLSEFNDDFPLYICIMDGKGFGQLRKVKFCEGNHIVLDKPWDVLPDKTSYFSLGTSTAHNVWLNNNSEFSNGSSQFIWNSGVENVICGQEINMAAGMVMHANYGSRNGQLCFCAFNKITKCQVRSSGEGLFLRSESWFGEYPDDFTEFYRTKGVFGNVIRLNTFDGSEGLMYVKNQGSFLEPKHDAGITMCGGYNMTEKNRIAGYHNGTQLINNCEGNYFAKNSYYGTKKRFTGDVKNVIGPDKE